MKKLVFIALFFTAFHTNAQNYDSLRRTIDELVIQQNEIDLRLQRSHEQFSSGTLLLGMGLGAALIGGVFFATHADDPGPIAPSLMIAGGAAAMTGSIIQIDAHKWLSRRWRRK